jgi:hypothetical protein
MFERHSCDSTRYPGQKSHAQISVNEAQIRVVAALKVKCDKAACVAYGGLNTIVALVWQSRYP